jgi:hypothetical protein
MKDGFGGLPKRFHRLVLFNTFPTKTYITIPRAIVARQPHGPKETISKLNKFLTEKSRRI